MKNPIAALIALLIIGASGLLILQTLANDPPISFEAERTITAGDAWSVLITVNVETESDSLQVDMFQGISHYQDTLALGSGGVARWTFAEGELTQAGKTLIVARNGDYRATFTLTVEATTPQTLIGFTTANSIAAYGEGNTTLIVMAADTYGNPIPKAVSHLSLTAPSGEQRSLPLAIINGLASYEFNSLGNPGLLRIRISLADVETHLTLIQQPGAINKINLALSSNCVLDDGLDDVTVTAQVSDAQDNPVVDGTVVTFSWTGGQASRSVINGFARLTVPAPTIADTYEYTVSGDDISSTKSLVVTASKCG